MTLANTNRLRDPSFMESLELIERTVAQLTGKPADVVCHEDEHGAIFEVFSPRDTNAFLVGRENATINALRTLAKAIGHNGKHRIKVILRERENVSSTKA